MAIVFWLLCSTLRTSLRSRAALQAENLALRHQLLVLERSTRGRRLRLRAADRIFWVWLSRLWQGWRSRAWIFKPNTVLSWGRKGFRLYWTWKSRARKGRPCVSREIRDLIRKMSLANPRWGAPRVHGELQKLGLDISEPTVAKYMVRFRRPSSQTWKTFLNNHMQDLVSTDFFVVLTGGANAANVFWQVGSSATLGTYSAFKGTIMAYASITIATGATLDGRALAQNAAVTLDTNAVTTNISAVKTDPGAAVTNTGPTIINGDLGVWAGTSVPGFPPGQVIGRYTPAILSHNRHKPP